MMSDVIPSAIVNLDYVPEKFKREFLKEKLEGTEHDTCSDIFCEYIGTACDGEMDNTIDGIKIVYIGELKEISF